MWVCCGVDGFGWYKRVEDVVLVSMLVVMLVEMWGKKIGPGKFVRKIGKILQF